MNDKESLIKLDIFSSERKLYFLYKKTEKLISAIYLVTDHLSDRESIKWSLRESGVELLEEVFSYTIEDRLNNHIKFLQADFLKMISLLEVAHLSGFISRVNFGIVSSEFKGLLDIIDRFYKEKALGERVAFPQGFFGESVKDFESEYDIKDNEQFKGNSLFSSIEKSSDQKKDHKGHEITLSQEVKKNIKNARRDSILAVLKAKGGGLTIKDIGYVVKGCSEKTIQRELQDLIISGQLRKEGERRWSKYYLNSLRNEEGGENSKES